MTIKVIKRKQDFNIYLKEILWFFLKPTFIMGIIVSIFTLYCLIMGIFFDQSILFYAIILMFLVLFLLLFIIRIIFIYKRNLKGYFKRTDEFGNIEFLLSSNNGELVIENVTLKTLIRINYDDIKFIKYSKKCIFLKTKYYGFTWFPKTDELTAFFKSC